jgi:hypothetical protein
VSEKAQLYAARGIDEEASLGLPIEKPLSAVAMRSEVIYFSKTHYREQANSVAAAVDWSPVLPPVASVASFIGSPRTRSSCNTIGSAALLDLQERFIVA